MVNTEDFICKTLEVKKKTQIKTDRPSDGEVVLLVREEQ